MFGTMYEVNYIAILVRCIIIFLKMSCAMWHGRTYSYAISS